MNYGSSKNAEIELSNSIFYIKNRRNFFKKKYLFDKHSLLNAFRPSKKFRRPFFVKTFFSNFNFWTTLKWMPNFWRTVAFTQFSKFNNFLWVCWFFSFLYPLFGNSTTCIAIRKMAKTFCLDSVILFHSKFMYWICHYKFSFHSKSTSTR